jgi:NodT family efflux transporter outer membrane factor (OMF) lipoprotein
LKAARSAREGVALSVTADVGLAYLDILGTRQRLSIARQNLDTAKRLLSSVGRMVKAGVSSPLDLVQQQALVAGREADLPVLVQEEKEARDALALLLGQAPEGLTVAGESLDGISIPAVAPGLPSDLLARRPDIAEAEARLKAAHADVAAARAAFFPTISLTASGGITSDALAAVRGGSALDDVIVGAGSPGWIYGIGASLVQSIFDGGRKKATREIASAREQELLAEYRRAVFNAFSDVETALGRSSSLAESERKKTEQMEKASEAFDISQRQYRQGLIDLLAVLEAQQTLFDARDQLAQTRLARIKAVLSLYKALGGGWRTPEQTALAGK